MLIYRFSAILAASLLVAAFSLFMLTPEDMSLLQGLSRLDPGLPVHLHSGTRHLLGNVVWGRVLVPVLARPVWLMPLCLGLIVAGLAYSFSGAAAVERSRKRS